MRHLIVLTIMALGLMGCKSDKDGLTEKASIEGKAASEAQIASENENLATKASQMEEDLAQRHGFYQSIKGQYDGDIDVKGVAYKIRFNLTPSLNPYKVSRTRQLEEIAADLNGLYLNVNVVQWNPQNELSAVGCQINGIRPDIINGEITIASESCPNFYALKLDGNRSDVMEIVGLVSPANNAAVYSFRVSKTKR